MKKELVYTLPYETAEQIENAKELQADLYSEYDSVLVYPNGRYEVRIVATND